MALMRVLLLSLVATQAFAVDKSVVEEELSRAPAPFKMLAVNDAVKGNLPGLTAAACPLVMKTNTQITPFPIRSDAVPSAQQPVCMCCIRPDGQYPWQA